MQFGNLVSQHRDTASTFYHFDALGSTEALTDSSEVITDSYTYKAFGELNDSSGSTANPYQWVGVVGYRKDDDTGRYNLRRRDYQSAFARFLSEDPAVDDPLGNLYRYVENNPVIFTDPSGRGLRELWRDFVFVIDAFRYGILATINAIYGYLRAFRNCLEGLWKIIKNPPKALKCCLDAIKTAWSLTKSIIENAVVALQVLQKLQGVGQRLAQAGWQVFWDAPFNPRATIIWLAKIVNFVRGVKIRGTIRVLMAKFIFPWANVALLVCRSLAGCVKIGEALKKLKAKNPIEKLKIFTREIHEMIKEFIGNIPWPPGF